MTSVLKPLCSEILIMPQSGRNQCELDEMRLAGIGESSSD